MPNHNATDRTAACRNCGEPGALVLHQGELAPFFASRVLDVQVASRGERLGRPRRPSRFSAARTVLVDLLLRLLGATWRGRRYLDARSSITTRIRACRRCGFVGPHAGYHDDQLLNLYRDYRSDAYNAERALHEPAYRRIQGLVGNSQTALEGRLANVGNLLRAHLDLAAVHSVLDWGGGEGKFVPRELRDKKVVILDVSSEALAHPGYTRIDEPPSGIQFEFVQVCHVLEHVVSPRSFLEKVLPHVKPGGYLYLEVPQDRSEQDVQGLAAGRPELRHLIHEHLNLFTPRSLRALAGSLGLRELVIQATTIDMEWIQPTVVSGLFVRP
jgi:SAM-dependent methyltransferase